MVSTLLIGSLKLLTTLAQMLLVDALVTRQDVAAAIALGSIAINMASFIGPAIAAALLVWKEWA